METFKGWEVRESASRIIVATFTYRCDALTFARKASNSGDMTYEVKWINDGAVCLYQAGKRLKANYVK